MIDIRSAIAAAVLVLAACGPSAPSQQDEPNTAVFIATNDSLVAPAVTLAGYTTVRLDNDSDSLLAHEIVRLKDGVTPDSGLRAARIFQGLDTGNRVAALSAFDRFYGGAVFVAPKTSKSVGVRLQAGNYISYADVVSGDAPRARDGFIAPLIVMPSADSTKPPTPDYVIRMLDFRFESRRTARAGRTRWRIENGGATEHVVFIVRILPGHTYEETKAWLANPDGPPPLEDAEKTVGVHALSPGVFNDVELELERGDYVVVCFVAGHQMMGMVSPLTVTD